MTLLKLNGNPFQPSNAVPDDLVQNYNRKIYPLYDLFFGPLP